MQIWIHSIGIWLDIFGDFDCLESSTPWFRETSERQYTLWRGANFSGTFPVVEEKTFVSVDFVPFAV